MRSVVCARLGVLIDFHFHTFLLRCWRRVRGCGYAACPLLLRHVFRRTQSKRRVGGKKSRSNLEDKREEWAGRPWMKRIEFVRGVLFRGIENYCYFRPLLNRRREGRSTNRSDFGWPE